MPPRRMGDLVEGEFRGIVWNPCAAHCFDLMMEDMGKLPWVQSVLADANRITYLKKNTKHWLSFAARAPTLIWYDSPRLESLMRTWSWSVCRLHDPL